MSASPAMPSIPFFMEHATVDLMQPRIDDVRWPDIARTLSRLARYNGRTGQGAAYSVAQHCIIGADTLARETGDSILAGYFLLHDAHEAFVGDITAPVSNFFVRYLGESFGFVLDDLKHGWDWAIFSKAALPSIHTYEKKDVVKEMDRRMLAVECLTFFPQSKSQFGSASQYRIPHTIKPMGAALAEEQFLDRLSRYLGIRTRD